MSAAAALLVAVLLAAAGRALGWLSPGGAVAAGAVGTAVLWGAGLAGGALLAVFFGSGSALTYGRARRDAVPPAERRGRRAWQVLANGGWAALGAALVAADVRGGWAMLAGALAAAQADTWATEIGRLAPRPPRLVTSWRPVPTGTSGAVSLLGTGAGALGAGTIAALAWVLAAPGGAAAAAAGGGVIGMAADSLLGATVQGRYYCETCAADTEQRRHACGRPAAPRRGWAWLDNDGVNFAASGVGAVASVALYLS